MVLTFKINLAKITKPPVWRRVTVPANFTFNDFHSVIQWAFGWTNSHLHYFSQKPEGLDVVIGDPTDHEWNDVIDSTKIKLSKVFTLGGQCFYYVYDFGDDWVHKIKLQEMDTGQAKRADCIAGKGACPPEDCGGPGGYEEFKKIMADPGHADYEDMRVWAGLREGQQWDAAAFDIEAARESVRAVGKF
jgi:hypothetical protein